MANKIAALPFRVRSSVPAIRSPFALPSLSVHRSLLHRLRHPLPLSSHYTTSSNEDSRTQSATQATAKRKLAVRASPASTSLRRTALDAQRGRLQQQNPVQGRGRNRHLLPSFPTKNVTAYCSAETYQLSAARHLLQQHGYHVDPLGTNLGAQVVHVQAPSFATTDLDAGPGDIFVFPSGSVVAWNVPERISSTIVHRILPAAAENGHLERLEVEDMAYVESPHSDTSEIIGDTIVLGTKPAPSPSHLSTAPDDREAPEPNPALETILAKIAYSSALARSTKLAVLEDLLSAYFHSTRSIPSTLSGGTPLRFTRSFILRKTGELLSIRAQLNLYSELTDSLPDLFWDSPHELGLESYYDSLGRALDVGVRIKVLNEKMDYASEIAAVLRERLSEKQSTGLEWLIIGLISIEVAFGVFHLWKEGREEAEMERVRGLLERYLDFEINKSNNVKPRVE